MKYLELAKYNLIATLKQIKYILWLIVFYWVGYLLFYLIPPNVTELVDRCHIQDIGTDWIWCDNFFQWFMMHFLFSFIGFYICMLILLIINEIFYKKGKNDVNSGSGVK